MYSWYWIESLFGVVLIATMIFIYNSLFYTMYFYVTLSVTTNRYNNNIIVGNNIQWTSINTKFTYVCISSIVNCLIKSKFTTYTIDTSSSITDSNDSLYFTSWIVKPVTNFIIIAMVLLFWISFAFIMKYGTNLLLFAKIDQNLDQFYCYLLIQLIINVIQRLLTIIIFIFIDKTFENILKRYLLSVVIFLKDLSQCIY